MAAKTSPTSEWVESYTDKTDAWVRARLEHLEDKERLSQTGSIPRRKEIRLLRVELLTRKKVADAAGANPAAPASGNAALASPGRPPASRSLSPR